MAPQDDRTRERAFHFVEGGELRLEGAPAVAIGPQPVVAGRDPRCGVVVDDPEVSATHFDVRAEPEGVVLRDLGSRNGTFIAGVRITEATLVAPCTIEVGRARLSFVPVGRQAFELEGEESFGPLVGAAPRMRAVFRMIREVAPTELSVLITGETGCGKELVAQAIHDASPRASGPFVVLDCAALPASLAESVLFGHERGAFTGAHERRRGAFQEAHGGTIFLDELGELPVEVQPKLLRALAERKVKRIGTNTYEPVDVRVLAATRRDLGSSMNAGSFRSDLFFRLAQVRIELPPLRARREDIPLLVRAVCERLGKPDRTADVTALVVGALAQHDWPGNVRELVNVASVAASLPPGAETVHDMLPIERGGSSGDPAPATSPYGEAKRLALAAFEQRFFSDLHRATGGNISEMARRCGLGRHHIRAYLRKYNLLGT